MHARLCDPDVGVKKMGSGGRQASPLTAARLWATSSSLGFPTGNIEMLVPASQGTVRIQWDSAEKILSAGLPRATAPCLGAVLAVIVTAPLRAPR